MKLSMTSKRMTSISPYKRAFEKQAYLLLALPLIGFFVFTLYPLSWAIRYAFYYYDGSISTTHFVGLQNFISAFNDSSYWKAWITTLQFAACKMPVELPLALLLAILLHRKVKGVGFFRSVYFMPHIISVAIIGLIFTNMFDYFGLINNWLTKLGLLSHNVEWFSTKWKAMVVLVSGHTWQNFGINVLYFMAALNNIPEELYEAASIDGATAWIKFRKITVPMMGPVLQTILLLSINGTLHINDYIIATTNGGPGGNTYTVMSYLVGKFVPGFGTVGANIGYGCCLAVLTAIIMGAIALGYTKVSNKLSNIY